MNRRGVDVRRREVGCYLDRVNRCGEGILQYGIRITTQINFMQQGDNRPRRIAVFAAGVALALCLAAAVAVRFQTYDPAASAGSETFLDYCLFAGLWLVPFASVCFAKRLFYGCRFRFVLSWLVGFLIPWALLVYETCFPHSPQEGSYCTKTWEVFQSAFFVIIVTGVINGFDSLIERLLCKFGNRHSCFGAWLQMAVLFSVLLVGVVSALTVML